MERKIYCSAELYSPALFFGHKSPLHVTGPCHLVIDGLPPMVMTTEFAEFCMAIDLVPKNGPYPVMAIALMTFRIKLRKTTSSKLCTWAHCSVLKK